MIIELIGPKGVGKSTVAPAVAEKLGIRRYLGQAFHGLDGKPMSPWGQGFDRIVSLLRTPTLFVVAFRIQGGTSKERMRFALNACRRDRFASRAAAGESGILESGPLNSLFQATASYGRDVSTLHSRIFLSDVYVRLKAPAEETTRRLEHRGGVGESRLAEHGDWVSRYEMVADAVLPRIGRPVLMIDAHRTPEEVAKSIVAGLREHGWAETLESQRQK